MTLTSRENKLRREAAKKNLFIRKRKWREYFTEYSFQTHTGYCIGDYLHGLIVYGGDSWGNYLPTLEEAENFIAEY